MYKCIAHPIKMLIMLQIHYVYVMSHINVHKDQKFYQIFKFFLTYIYNHNFKVKRALHFMPSEIRNFIWQRQISPDARSCWLAVCAFYKSSAARLRAHVVLLLQAQVYKFSFGKLPQK